MRAFASKDYNWDATIDRDIIGFVQSARLQPDLPHSSFLYFHARNISCMYISKASCTDNDLIRRIIFFLYGRFTAG